MAGLGEVCSHVASLLFYIEAVVKMAKEKSCTEELATWNMPKAVRSIPYLPLADINFGTGESPPNAQNTTPLVTVAPSSEEIHNFFVNLSLSSSKPAILSLIPEFSDKYQPLSVRAGNLLLSNLYKPSNLGLDDQYLLLKCDSVELSVPLQLLEEIETATISQSKSNFWFEIRAGRVTASKFKSVCATNTLNPSLSLMKQICYPIENRFSTPATNWGMKHKKEALQLFKEGMELSHQNYK